MVEPGCDLGPSPGGPSTSAAGPGPADDAWSDIVAGPEVPDSQVPRDPDDLADILYTSGTTGSPKGVTATHANILASGGGGALLGQLFGGGTFLHAIPLFTFAGAHGMQYIPIRARMTSVVMPRFDARRYLELAAEHQVALTFVVPSMVQLLLADEGIEDADLSSLKMMMFGTAPMPLPALQQIGERLPDTILINVYGLTEGGGAICALPPGEARKRPGAIGKPVPPTELRIVRPDGTLCDVHEAGEVEMRTPTRRSYYRNEEATGRTWTADGWLRTGDMGFVDDDGYVVLSGRNKDVIVRGGFNVHPPEVEGVLCEHPAVREAAVVGMPHPVLGEDVVAFVVLTRHRGTDMVDALRARCHERLADYKRPRSYHVVDTLPRNALGKVLKRVLREQLAHG